MTYIFNDLGILQCKGKNMTNHQGLVHGTLMTHYISGIYAITLMDNCLWYYIGSR